jgi:hypothetical protein
MVSIQMAIVRPDWTSIFCDHNVMIFFHVMRLKRSCVPSDFWPGSMVSHIFSYYLLSVSTKLYFSLLAQLWERMWSNTHSSVYSLKPDCFNTSLEAWRRQMIDSELSVPIFL